MRQDLPSGTVTFVFTDIEGSTRLLDRLGTDAFKDALAEHRRVVRSAFGAGQGVEVDTQGDAFFFAFADASLAVASAAQAQAALARGPIHVRIGIHTGQAHLSQEGYVGHDVHRAARIAAAGHGGQVLMSRQTRTSIDENLKVADLGEHRLKDFAEPIWLYQLGEERFPPLRTISNTNLPRPVSSFVGREREVAELVAALRGGARLVTLTGPGGTGKTRLAIEAATDLVSDFRNGVFWVGLAAIRDAAMVSEEIGRTLGAREAIAHHIGDREMLLVLDNLEQVVEVGPDLAGLLERCPKLRMLVTSRELLRVRGEVEYAVDPLPLAEAVGLFVARAQLQPDAAITQLCQRLEGLPLAVELAAARARFLSPAQLLDRLGQRLDLLKGGRDADARQQTLRATIAWSHDLLAADERQLFARLAVFRGGFSLEAAEAIAEADIDTLQSLTDKSLIRVRDERFAMLETVREFAAEQLAAQPDARDLARRHADYFLALAVEAEPHLPAYDRTWIDRLEDEHDNLRAAFDLYAEAGEGQSMQRLAGALARFWFMRGYSVEGSRRLEAALASDDTPTLARAEALLGASLSGSRQEDEERARQAGEIFRLRGDRRGEALADLSMGNMRAAAGDWQQGRELLERSLATMVDLAEDHHALIVRRGLGWIYVELGLRSQGMAIHRDNLQRARDLGNQRIEAITLGALAMETLAQGGRDEATRLLDESHRLHAAIGDPFQSALDVFRFASLILAHGKAETAAKLVACSDALIDEMGLSLRAWDPTFVADVNRRLREELDSETLARAMAEGRRLSADAAVALATRNLAHGSDSDTGST